MSSKMGRGRGRNSGSDAQTSVIDGALLTLANVIRRAPLWKRTDVDAVADALSKIKREINPAVIRLRIPRSDAAAQEALNSRLAEAIVNLLPSLMSQFLSCDSRGQSVNGVSMESFIATLELLSDVINATAYDRSIARLNFDSPVYEKVRTVIAVPVMAFLNELVNSGDALWRNVKLLHVATQLVRAVIFSNGDGDPPTHIIHACSKVTETLDVLLSAIEYDVEFRGLLDACCLVIDQLGYDDHPEDVCLPPDVEQLVRGLLRTAVRVGFFPGTESLFDGARMLQTLEMWAALHCDAHFSHTKVTIAHYAAWPMICAWCTNEKVFQDVPESCYQVLYWFCYVLLHAKPEDALTPFDDFERVIQFLVGQLRGVDDSFDEETYDDCLYLLHSILRMRISRDAAFDEDLDDSEIVAMIERNIPVPTPPGFYTSFSTSTWEQVMLRWDPDVLEGFLARGLPAAQALVDCAANAFSPRPYESAGPADEDHRMDFLYFVLTKTASFEGISYAPLVANYSSIIDECCTTDVLAKVSSEPAAAMLHILMCLSGYDTACDDLIRAELRTLFLQVATLDDGTDKHPFPWTPKGWRLRSQLIDMYLALVVFTEVSAEEKASNDYLKEQIA